MTYIQYKDHRRYPGAGSYSVYTACVARENMLTDGTTNLNELQRPTCKEAAINSQKEWKTMRAYKAPHRGSLRYFYSGSLIDPDMTGWELLGAVGVR